MAFGFADEQHLAAINVGQPGQMFNRHLAVADPLAGNGVEFATEGVPAEDTDAERRVRVGIGLGRPRVNFAKLYRKAALTQYSL